jgi:hypothetical protein
MPAQTTKTSNVFFPDGCLVEVDDGDGYFDLGAINSAVTNTLEWTENRIESANAGTLQVQIRNMQMTGGFTLINLDPEGVEKLGGGMFERVETTGAVTPENQTQTSPQVLVLNHLILLDDEGNNLRPEAAPTVTSVTGGTAGALTVNTDYDIIADNTSPSGYSIRYESGAINGSENVVIIYPSQTMLTSQVMYVGKSTDNLTAYSMRFTHTDDNSKIRRLELFSVDTGSGGIQFNFKGANEDGVEEMPITYIAKLDTSLTSGRQLAAWTIETGAE